VRVLLAILLSATCLTLVSCIALPWRDDVDEQTPITDESTDSADTDDSVADQPVRRVEPLVHRAPRGPLPVHLPVDPATGSVSEIATAPPPAGSAARATRRGRLRSAPSRRRPNCRR